MSRTTVVERNSPTMTSNNNNHTAASPSKHKKSPAVLFCRQSSSCAENAVYHSLLIFGSVFALSMTAGVGGYKLFQALSEQGATAITGNTGEEAKSMFARGTGNIHWCEDVIAHHTQGEWIAEFWNTWTNFGYAAVAVYGLRRCYLLQLPRAFVLAECSMLLVAFGSMYFHAYQSKFAEFLDELPMCLLAAVYHECGRGLHPMARPPYDKYLYGTVQTLTVALLSLYLITNVFEIFALVFGFQILILLGFSIDGARRLNVSLGGNFAWGVGFVIIGKAVWEVERHRYKTNACSLPYTLWLHPLWHFGGALSHLFIMKFGVVMLDAHRRDMKLDSSPKAEAS